MLDAYLEQSEKRILKTTTGCLLILDVVDFVDNDVILVVPFLGGCVGRWANAVFVWFYLKPIYYFASVRGI